MTKRLVLIICASLFAAASLQALQLPDLRFETNTYNLREGDPPFVVRVHRYDEDLTHGLSVRFRWWMEAAPTDSLGDQTMSFAPGETVKSVSIPIPDDTLFYYHGNPAGAVWVEDFQEHIISGAGITLLDNDPLPTLTTDTPVVTVAEGNSGTTDAIVHFKLSALFANYVGYGFTTSGTANDLDFAAPQFTSGPGDATDVYALVRIKGDTLPENTETINVRLYVGPLHADASIIILNDEYLADPRSQQIERGQSGAITLSTSVAAAASERVAVSSSDPNVASVPPFIDIPAGATSATIPISGESAGSAVITVDMPASRGGTSFFSEVTVFQPSALTLDRSTLALTLGAQTTITVHLRPAPASPLTVPITNGQPQIAEMPSSFTIGTDGNGSFAVRAVGTGTASAIIALPAQYGGGTALLRVEVSLPTGLAITSLSTATGPAVGNQPVMLFGNAMQGRCSVTFGGVSALNTAVAASGSVATYTPPHAPGVVDVGIRCGTQEFTFAKAYTYTAAAPHIARLTPATGSISGGTIVTAFGENLPRGRCTLAFGEVTATTLTNFQTSEMTAIAPPHAAGAAGVTLRCGSDVSTLADAFVYTGEEPLAEIAAVNPSSAAPGERVTVAGSRFRPGDAISFGSAATLDTTTALNEHFVTVPELPAGAVTIAMRDADGRAVAGPSFTVKAPAAAQLTAAPARVTAGSEIVVNGSGFRPSLSFALGGVTLRSVVLAPIYAVLRVPGTMAPQTTTLAVKDAAGASLATRPVEVIATGVAIESASPPCVSTEGAALVTINGSGFEEGAVVTFGIADGTDMSVRDGHTIVVRAPASSGVTDAMITVTNPSLQSGQLTGAFQYRWPASDCGSAKHRAARH